MSWGRLSRFHSLATMNSATINILLD
jgi:hypothetical protein